MTFDAQPFIEGETLAIRPLVADDRAALHAAAADPAIWAGHPAKDRHRQEVFEPYFRFLLESGTAVAVVDRHHDTIIGCSRYYFAPDQPAGVSIGFTFLNAGYWGSTTNFELKRLMLGHAFEAFAEVWFHIAHSNLRSQKATAKLGAEHVYDATLDLSGVATPWMCFRLSRDAWQRTVIERTASRPHGSPGTP